MVTTYTYNSLNRLTDEVVKDANGITLASYAYTLGNAGNRTGVTETQLLPNGTVNTRTVAYQYDNLYRLTDETISGDSQGGNGTITYTYDLVGNRMSRTSNVAGVSTSTSTYNANDELTSEVDNGVTTNYTYDSNGNTTETSNGTTTTTFTYDSQNRLVKQNAGQSNEIDITYDGAGNKVAETVGGVTTKYLIDSNNPTGYSQIVEEIVNGAVTWRYALGHWIISETQNINGTWTTSFYGYDGHNSVRFLTNSAGVVTDNYTFDAFGVKIAGAGTTPNQILYSGEYLDSATGNYDLRGREYRQNSGTFTTMDTTPGQLPYVYTADNPVMFADPSGHDFSLSDTLFTISFQMSMIATQIAPAFQAITTVGTLALLVTDQNFAAQFVATGGNPVDLLGSLSEETIAGMRYLAEGSSAFAAIGGEIYAVVVDAQRAEQYLVDEAGLLADQAQKFVASFRNGGIVARVAEPGETFLRYYQDRQAGRFLTRMRFSSPAAAVEGLDLGNFGNDASLVQVVTVTKPTIIFEGGITGGGEAATQFFATDISAFQFGLGVPYGN